MRGWCSEHPRIKVGWPMAAGCMELLVWGPQDTRHPEGYGPRGPAACVGATGHTPSWRPTFYEARLLVWGPQDTRHPGGYGLRGPGGPQDTRHPGGYGLRGPAAITITHSLAQSCNYVGGVHVGTMTIINVSLITAIFILEAFRTCVYTFMEIYSSWQLFLNEKKLRNNLTRNTFGG